MTTRKPCCTPSRAAPADTLSDPLEAAAARVTRLATNAIEPAAALPERATTAPGTGDPLARRPELIALPGGSFVMGGTLDEAIQGDGEGPQREVKLSSFDIGRTSVTNREFSAFVRATRYVTDAERLGASFVFYLQLDAPTRGRIRQAPGGLPWWVEVPDACWQRPEGPGSDVHERPDHPVVHVSWHDAQAFCRWSDTRLPSEAQWEYAARGGLIGRRYPWGDDLEPKGKPLCNIWQGAFPLAPRAPWTPAPMACGSFEANGFGLHDMAGNVWEWCNDWFDPDYHAITDTVDPLLQRPGARRSQRGGSFLCHASYCNRYRVAARHSNTPLSAASNCGFRVVASTSSPSV